MGMFDYYEPEPPLSCPKCGNMLTGWQGKDGPSALFVWRQGHRHPVGQRAGENNVSDVTGFNLPARVSIYTYCCGNDLSVDAIGDVFDGVWIHTRLVEGDEVDAFYSHEPKAKRQARKRWLGT